MISSLNSDNISYVQELLKQFNYQISNVDDNPFRHILLYDKKGVIVYTKIYNRIEIEYIAVSKSFQRQGIASLLLKYVIEKNKGIKNITLEVRKSNIKAINFYLKHHFKQVALREKYYGKEDGILMLREFDKNDQ